MALHKNATVGNVHIIYNWEYADSDARTGATGFLASDVGKFARQLNDNSIWMLTDDDPVAWVCMQGIANPMTDQGDLIIGGASGAGARLALGTEGTLLKAGASAPEWVEDNSIHDDVASEIHSLTEKASLAGDDELIIEDSADSYNKKRIKASNLPSGGGGADILEVQVFM